MMGSPGSPKSSPAKHAGGTYTLFLQGCLSSIELRTFLDQELPDRLARLIRSSLRRYTMPRALVRDYLVLIARLRVLARSAAPRLDAVDVIPRRSDATVPGMPVGLRLTARVRKSGRLP